VLCLGVLNNAGGFVGAKKQEKSCNALREEGAESTMMGSWVVPARAGAAGEQQLLPSWWGWTEGYLQSCGSGAEKDWCVMEPGVSLSASSTPARGLSS